MNSEQQQAGSPRREFLKTTAAVAGGALAGHGTSWGFHHGVDQSLKVGLIGCGGRGTGAAMNAAQADPDVQITALCDVFADRITSCRTALQTQLGARCQVDDAHCFDGLEGYQKLIDSGVDVVLLCSTPYFRPDHMEAAVKAKKHIFCEKPIATDVAGSLRVLKACEAAAADDLNVVSGLCWRYDPAVLEVMRRIKEGAIGEIRAIQENYLTGTLWHRGNRPEWSPLEYQLRNWLYFTWLSGDLIAEQHIHSLDKSLWLMDDQPPARCYGTGGRQVRTEEKWGDIYDHFACCYEWDNGVKTFSYARQMSGCMTDVDDYVIGTQGRARVLRNEIAPTGGSAWRFERTEEMPDMYDAEHQALFAAIRNGQPINNGKYMCYSTLMAIMGREACYTGGLIEWDAFLASGQRLGPETLDWQNPPQPRVAMPGGAA